MPHVNGNKDYQINKAKEIFLKKIKEYNPEDVRICVVCGMKKKLSLFYSGITKTASGHDSFRISKKCKDCYREDMRKRHQLKMDDKSVLKRDNYRAKHRYTSLKVVYGISKEGYERMLLVQNGRCEICGDLMTKPYVDHCHSTNKVRGLLCMKCNMGLGHFKDSTVTMNNAIKYIEKYSIGSVSKPMTPITR